MQFFDFITSLSIVGMALVFLVSRLLGRKENLGEVVLYLYIFLFGSFLQVFGYFLFPLSSDSFSLAQKCFFLSVASAVFSLTSFVFSALKASSRSRLFATKSEINNSMVNLRGSVFDAVYQVRKAVDANSEDLKGCKKDIVALGEGVESIRDRLLKTLQIVSAIDNTLTVSRVEGGIKRRREPSY